MSHFPHILAVLLSASPIVLALVLALAAVSLAGFTVYVVHQLAIHRRKD